MTSHERICIFCRAFHLSFGEPGYSEYTPASPGSCYCIKGHFDLGEWSSEREFRDAIKKAVGCEDWEPYDRKASQQEQEDSDD